MNPRRIPFLLSVIAVLLSIGLFAAHPIHAASAVDQNAFAQFAANAGFATGPSIQVIIARLIRTAISMLGVITLVFVLYGGFMYMTAGGNDERIKKAKKILTNAAIGLVIVLTSFSITQFILSKLVEATSQADITAFCAEHPTDPTCQKTTPFPPPIPSFFLASVNTDCAQALRNFQLQFVFSKKIKETKGIRIRQNGVDVPGAFAVSGQKATFVPEATCPDSNADLHCFLANTSYDVVVDSTIMKSATGSTLTCSGQHPCQFSFTTGSGVDTQPPQTVAMTSPNDGGKAILGDILPLQATTKDDSGVSAVDFYVDDGTEPVYTAGIKDSNLKTLTGGLVENPFNTDPNVAWNVSGYVTNKSYNVWAVGTDCVGHTKTANRISVVVRAANCENSTTDSAAPYGETGLNCGGDATSPYYCGKCKLDACTENAQCSSGFCVAGKCQDVPVIQFVSPDNGAVDSLVTIKGYGFGSTPGSVDFLGTETGGTTKTVSAYQCSGKTSWKDDEIVVQIPTGSIDGPLKVNIPASGGTAAQSDRTDDAIGPVMTKFDVNAIKRPGLCSLDPGTGEINTSFKLNGILFGPSQGSSAVYLTGSEAKATAWSATQLTANVPNIPSQPYNAQVFTGDYVCLDAAGNKTATTCFTTEDCQKVDPSYTCGTSWCSETLSFCQSDTSCPKTKTQKACTKDADCNVAGDEFCDMATKVCTQTAGSCVDVRTGSNTEKFIVTGAPAGAKPIVSSVDTGWSVCSSGANKDKACIKDTDCPDGGRCGKEWKRCVAGDKNNQACNTDADCGGGSSCRTQYFGPPGQYLTIRGSNFGSAGYVNFLANDGSGHIAWGDGTFPAQCGGSGVWQSDTILVKVPKELISKAALDLTTTYNLSVVRNADAQASAEVVPFDIVNDKPGPSICKLDPISGPVGTPVSIAGENLGSSGSVLFAQNEKITPANFTAVPGSWTETLLENTMVPSGAKTGPLSISTSGKVSNTMNFSVGNCQTDSSIVCVAGTTCCASGTCSASCDDMAKIAHFAYKISTSPIPVAPTVVVNCKDTKLSRPSPSPSPLWSTQNDICVSAAVTASFSEPMDPTTLQSPNIQIQRCTQESNGACSQWADVAGTFQNPSELAFQWSPSDPFSTNTLYQVTIKGKGAAGGGVKSKPNGDIPGASMEKDFSWTFRTSTSSQPCGVGKVVVSPSDFTAKVAGQSVDYLAQLLSNQDDCVVLACTGHSIGWSSDQWATTFLPGDTLTAAPAVGICSISVDPRYNTPAGIKSHITATVTNESSKPSGVGLLEVALTDPKITDYFPNCSSACGNAVPWMKFNVPMNPAFFGMQGAVSIYKCQNAFCDQAQETFVNLISNISYDGNTNIAKLNLSNALDANTWYRVVVAGWVKSSVFAPLSKVGSNYGTDQNKFFPGSFSWRFKTKEGTDSCLVDHIGITPKASVMKYVGDRASFNAAAYGAPDDCSATGQMLKVATGWNPWIATDNPNKVGVATYVLGVGVTDHKLNEITSYALNDGALALTTQLPLGCASNCLNTGNPVKVGQAVCGNGATEAGESCDDGNTNSGDGCSAICLKEGTNAPTCGNGKIDANEECDDGNTNSGDGCSAICLKEGSTSVGAVCGDGVKDEDPVSKKGEACDDGNKNSGDGCSTNCLLEGSVTNPSGARCGNGKIEAGESCDDGNVADGDGCSSLCLNEGTFPGKDPTKAQCGNGIEDVGEDKGCDLGGGIVAPGCSNRCLKLGSDFRYTDKNGVPVPSFCGDGIVATGEQCDATVSATKVSGGYSVVQVASGAPVEVEQDSHSPNYGYAISKVQVSLSGKTGEASVSLFCSCESDAACGVKAGTTTSLACGTAKCCYERPLQPVLLPADGETNKCRNTAIVATFDQVMDEKSFGSADPKKEPNVQLELVKMKQDSNKDGAITAADADVAVNNTNCPYYEEQKQVGLNRAKQLFASVWNVIVRFFGQPAFAITLSPYENSTKCLMPVSYVQDPLTHQVSVHYSKALEPLATYRLTVKTDPNGTDANPEGVLSINHVGICLGDNKGVCLTSAKSATFTTGSDVCKLDVVKVNDDGIVPAPAVYQSKSSGYFSAKDETHGFHTQALSYRQNTGLFEVISPIASLYDWSWSWGQTVEDFSTPKPYADILGLAAASTTQNAQYKALGSNGTGDVIATAKIGADVLFKPPTSAQEVAGHAFETVYLCEHPWPDLASGFPFKDVDSGTATNFSMFYCRDVGDPKNGVVLPALTLPPTVSTPASKNIDSDVLKEMVFNIAGTKDSIGVRVLKNPNYLSPMAWFKSKQFTGSPKPVVFDGYQGVQTGTTLYVAATNKQGSTVFSNIYVISYNEDAGKDAQQIFDLILQNFRLNANDAAADGVSHVGLCKNANTYPKVTRDNKESFVACQWDGDCVDQCIPGTPNYLCSISGKQCDPAKGNTECDAPTTYGSCDADKQKLARDMKRLTDVTDMIASFEKYGGSHAHCSVSKNQSCKVNADCPGTESCVPGYPTLQSGTFVPSLSNSVWTSWNSSLGNAVGAALPTDPINQFWNQCRDQGTGFDPATCWNGNQGKFICPDGSHVYGYQNKGGEDYTLSTELEYNAVPWSDAIDTSSTDHATIQASYQVGKAPAGTKNGFTAAPQFCNAAAFGTSTICGDGVKGSGEACEKGEVKAIACAGGAGTINVTCKNDCSGFQDETQAKAAGATCIAYTCGNGVKDPGEDCDDGTLNGTYGHCGLGCKVATAFACGDGYLAGNEQCDCGTPQNFSTLAATSWAKSGNHCDTYNGGYSASGKNCTADCKLPGPMCGDKIVNGNEVCDGASETYAGKLCSDGSTKCTTDADCGGAAGSCGSGGNIACGKALICIGGTNAGNVCTTQANCPGGMCSKTCSAGDATKVGKACDADANCGTNGKCTGQQYDLTRTRACTNVCTWGSGWSACQGGPQQCGNGKVEGTEECDDGNTSNYDSCTNACKKNVCGDGFVNTGIESCDAGSNNGQVCTAAYGSTCNYCNQYCQYKTQSGPYCGDGVRNGNEFCDGTDLPLTCFKADPQRCIGGTKNNQLCTKDADCPGNGKCADHGNIQLGGSCARADEGKVGEAATATSDRWECSTLQTYCRPAGTCSSGTNKYGSTNYCSQDSDCQSGKCTIATNFDTGCYGGYGTCQHVTKPYTGCSVGFTCRQVGVCDGGNQNGENGRPCTTGGLGYEYEPPENKNYCDHSYSGATDTGYGTCVLPTCASNCGSGCPTSFQKITLQVLPDVANAQPTTSVQLYSSSDAGTKSTPRNATILFPACRVGTQLLTDVSTGSGTAPASLTATLIAPTVKTSGVQQYTPPSTSAIDFGNGMILPLPGGFICHDTPFSVPFSTAFTQAGSSVSFKNFEFTYCPVQ